ncbi:MAG: hypothetical protein EOO15_21505 [Chitinophagaceae bacterium]|nr:MAG: hypothetical protein EOO15_21505 [Chitinophagaceae bacterium]
MSRNTPQAIEFRKPVEILELWRCKRLFQKNDSTPEERHRPFEWTAFESPFGAVADGKLLLSKAAADGIDLKTVQVLLLVSDHPANNNQSYYHAGCAAQPSPHPVKLDIIKADPRGEWPLYFSNPGWHDPKTDAFRVATLEPGEAVEIRANQKHDGYHQRMYIEYDYVFLRSGPFREATVSQGPFQIIPPAQRRLVDLRKLLW